MSYFKLDFTELIMDSDAELSSIHELSDEEEADTLLDRLPPPRHDRTHQAREGGRLIKPKERKHILLTVMTGIVFSTQFACRGYVDGVLYTIQHSLDISEAEAWLIDMSFDIGVVVGVIFLLGCRSCISRPRCVAIGSFLIGAGLFSSSVPYFMLHPSPTWLSSPATSNLPAYELCVVGKVPDDNGGDGGPNNEDDDYVNSLYGKEVAIIMGMIIAGLGAAPQWICGFPYLLDRTQKHPIVIVALYLVASVLGRWVGEILAYVIEHNTEPMSPYGALSRWWLGFLLLGLNGLLMALILVMYNDVPEGGRTLANQNGHYTRLKSESSSTLGNNDQQTVIGSPLGEPDQTDSFYYMRLNDGVGASSAQDTSGKCNIYKGYNVILLCIATSLEAAILTGFLVFQPRYYGVITGIGEFESRFYFSTAVLVGLLFGIIIGIVLCVIMKPSVIMMWKMTWIVCLITMAVTWVLFLYSCKEAPVNAYRPNPDPKTKADDLSKWVDLNATCSNRCSCPNDAWHPVCGSDHVTYVSPCLAGCQNLRGSTQYNFTNCLCIDGANNGTGSAVGGPCPANCKPMWTILLDNFFIFLLTGVSLPVSVLLITGTVKVQKRGQSLAVMVLMWHLLGVLPGIGIFNAVLGQACSLWQSRNEFTGQHYSDCLLYNSDKHHIFFVGLVLFFKVVAFILYGISYRATVKLKQAEDEIITNRNWIGFNGERGSVELGRVDEGTRAASSPAFI